MDLLGIKKAKVKINASVSLEKLRFLSTEMLRGNDKPTDVKFWLEEIRKLEELDCSRIYGLSHAIEAYQILFQLFLKKHQLEESSISLPTK